jgi:hypothetical protein
MPKLNTISDQIGSKNLQAKKKKMVTKSAPHTVQVVPVATPNVGF